MSAPLHLVRVGDRAQPCQAQRRRVLTRQSKPIPAEIVPWTNAQHLQMKVWNACFAPSNRPALLAPWLSHPKTDTKCLSTCPVRSLRASSRKEQTRNEQSQRFRLYRAAYCFVVSLAEKCIHGSRLPHAPGRLLLPAVAAAPERVALARTRKVLPRRVRMRAAGHARPGAAGRSSAVGKNTLSSPWPP